MTSIKEVKQKEELIAFQREVICQTQRTMLLATVSFLMSFVAIAMSVASTLS